MKNRKLYIFALLPFVIGLIVGSFYDLQINQALFMDPKTNVFGLIFSAFMPILSYAFFAVMAGISFYWFRKEKPVFKKILYMAFTVGFYAVSVYFTQDKIFSINAFGVFEGAEKLGWLGWLGCALVEAIFGVLGYLYGKHSDNKHAFYAGLLLAVAVVWALVPFAQLFKIIFRRPRYRTLTEEYFVPGAAFRNWWESFKGSYDQIVASPGVVKDISEEFKSFPSGHTGEAAVLIFTLPYLSKLEPRLKNKETLMFIIGLVYTLIMGFSRMTMGAHYLSDISMGAIFTIVCCIIANEINIKRHLDHKKDPTID